MSDKAYNVVNTDSQKPLILTCEHASALIPDSYQNLGLDADCLNTHIARDKGCRELTLSLAEQLGVTAFIGGYSRLLIDLNRQENEKELIVQSSDGIDIPANKNLSDEEKEKRLKSYYYPYHRAIDDKIETLIKQGIKPRIFSVHAFTPQLRGGSYRPWNAGILFNKENPYAANVYAKIKDIAGLNIETNVPYDLRLYKTGSSFVHGEEKGLDNCLIEIRDDEFDNLDAGVKKWTSILAEVII